jgi:hypothetical protein
MAKKKLKTLASVGDRDRWKVENDLEFLLKAEEIEADPQRMALVRELAKKKMMETAKVAADKD